VAKEHHAHENEPEEGGLTKEDVDKELAEAAERKRRIDEDRARKAGEDYRHVSVARP